jgi:dTDP-4-dehydrorhamnose reductase
MARRVVVLGAMGMLGGAVLARLRSSKHCDVVGTFHAKGRSDERSLVHFDACGDGAALEKLVRGADAVVNCVAILAGALQASGGIDPLVALQVNSVFPKRLAQVAEQLGVRVVHISSDAVFSGQGGAPYSEASLPDPQDLYGVSKLLGEVSAPNVLNIRTSLIGVDRTYHRGLLEWVLSQTKGGRIKGYDNHLWQGVTTVQLAELIATLLEDDAFGRARDEGGVHHFCPNPALSKYELLCILSEATRPDLTIEKVSAPGGTIDRRLRSNYAVLAECYRGPHGIQQAVTELLQGEHV